MIEKSSSLYTIVILLILLTPFQVFGAEYHGRVSMDDYYSNESGSVNDFHLLTTRIRMDAAKLNKAENLSFHFEGRERTNLGSQDYSSSIRMGQIDTMNFEYNRNANTDYLIGRLWPKELYAERIDGINILRHGKDSGTGFFAGLKPDPYTQGFNSNYSAAGVYYYRRKTNNNTNIAFIHNGFKGKTDRQYLYGQMSYYPSDKISIYGTMTADMNQTTKGLDLSNAVIELTCRPDYRKGISIGFSSFRSIRFYESMDFTIDTSTQQSYYVRGDYRFNDRYSVYGRFDLQTLHYNSLDQDLSSATTYQIGIRNDNLLNSRVSMDLNATTADSYGSGYNNYEIQFSRYFNDSLQLNLHSAFTRTVSDIIDYTDNIFTYDVSGHYTFSRMWTASLSYQGRSSQDYEAETIMSRISYRF